MQLSRKNKFDGRSLHTTHCVMQPNVIVLLLSYFCSHLFYTLSSFDIFLCRIPKETPHCTTPFPRSGMTWLLCCWRLMLMSRWQIIMVSMRCTMRLYVETQGELLAMVSRIITQVMLRFLLGQSNWELFAITSCIRVRLKVYLAIYYVKNIFQELAQKSSKRAF